MTFLLPIYCRLPISCASSRSTENKPSTSSQSAAVDNPWEATLFQANPAVETEGQNSKREQLSLGFQYDSWLGDLDSNQD